MSRKINHGKVMRYLASISSLLFLGLLFLTVSCFEEDKLDTPVNAVDEPVSDLEKYIDENFVQKYGIAIRYKFVDNFVDPGQRVAPPKLELVKPMLDFVDEFWIGVFADAPGGKNFLEIMFQLNWCFWVARYLTVMVHRRWVLPMPGPELHLQM